MTKKRYSVSVAEARAQLGNVIDDVEDGAAVEITRRGKPVAIVLSKTDFERLSQGRPSFEETYAAFLDRFSVDEIGIATDHFSEARDKAPGRPVRL